MIAKKRYKHSVHIVRLRCIGLSITSYEQPGYEFQMFWAERWLCTAAHPEHTFRCYHLGSAVHHGASTYRELLYTMQGEGLKTLVLGDW